jgi:hypothetical protein
MVLDLILKSLVLITQLTEFQGHRNFCFLVDGNDEDISSDWSQLKDAAINYATFVTCEK